MYCFVWCWVRCKYFECLLYGMVYGLWIVYILFFVVDVVLFFIDFFFIGFLGRVLEVMWFVCGISCGYYGRCRMNESFGRGIGKVWGYFCLLFVNFLLNVVYKCVCFGLWE